MKAFLFSDLHNSYRALSAMHDYCRQQKFPVIIFAGDAVDMGEPVSFIEELIWVIGDLGAQFFWVPGNNDFGRAYHKLNARYKSLEGKIAEYQGLKYSGVGGSPASWSGQYQGERSVDRKAIAETIFVSHVPPPGINSFRKTDDAIINNQSSIIKQIPNSNDQNTNVIARSGFAAKQSENLPKQDKIATPPLKEGGLAMTSGNRPLKLADSPKVHICGHVHHTWGVGYLGSTKVIKLAGAYLGYYAIMDLQTLTVKFGRMWK